jgi:hypothetical protein
MHHRKAIGISRLDLAGPLEVRKQLRLTDRKFAQFIVCGFPHKIAIVRSFYTVGK